MDRWLCEDLGDWLEHRLGAREIAPGEENRPWFFLRYQDPHWHLRIRYSEEDAATRGRLRSELDRLAASLPGLRTLTWDTYEPELDRYGGEQGTALSESIFYIDSRVALSRRRFFAREVDAWERLYASIAGLRALLDGLDLPLSTQLDLLSRMRGSFLSEHAADKATRADLSAEYRRRQAPIERAAAPPSVAAREAELSPLATLRPLAARFRELHQAGAIHRSLEEVAPSFVHMHMNRWFESEQRRQEMISYDFAWRAVRSLLARQKASP
jgi:thiopeptide-type bacteriocin biosynthesis protein